MEPESQKRATLSESCPDRVDAHGVRYDEVGKSFNDMARDLCQTSDAYRELLTLQLPGCGLSATRQAAANTVHATALLIEAANGRRDGGDLLLYIDPVQVRGPHGQIVPPRQSSEAMGEWEDVAPVTFAVPEGPVWHDSPTTGGGLRP